MTSQLLEFFLRFLSDSMINMLHAFMWPVYVVQWQPPLGAIALGIAFWLFPIYLKPHITAWLFDESNEDKGEPEGVQRK